jgi:hypothetical protein
MPEDILTLIGLSRAGPASPPFWTRAVPAGSFSAISLVDGKTPDRATLIAICRACCYAMPDFVPVAPTRIRRDELARYAAGQQESLGALIARVGGRQETILTLEWKRRPATALPPPGDGRDWLRRRALQWRTASDRRDALDELANRLAAPAMGLAQAHAINTFEGGCDLSLLHRPGDQQALASRLEAETRAQALALQGITTGLSGPFPPYSFVYLPPHCESERRDAPA